MSAQGSARSLLLPGCARLVGPLSDYEMKESVRAAEQVALTESAEVAESKFDEKNRVCKAI